MSRAVLTEPLTACVPLDAPVPGRLPDRATGIATAFVATGSGALPPKFAEWAYSAAICAKTVHPLRLARDEGSRQVVALRVDRGLRDLAPPLLTKPITRDELIEA